MATDRAVRLVLSGVAENTVRTTVLHYRTPNLHTWTQPELLTLATNFWNAVRASAKATAAGGVNWLSVTATDLGDDLLPTQAVYNIPQPEPGTVAGDMLPANVSCCISWKTPYAHRSLRGRTFWYGMIDTAAAGSIFSSTYLALVANFAAACLAFVNAGGVGCQLGILSRSLSLITPVTTYLIDATSDSQRRRLPNRGI